MTDATAIGPLFTDLYEITMAAGFHANGLNDTATFSVYARHSPDRSHYVFAGLADIIAALSSFRFSRDDIGYLSETNRFDQAFLAYLQDLTFTGSAVALPEGTVFFPDEPMMEITAPIIEAQLVETLVLNTLGFATVAATKASRCVSAAHGRPVIDFSLRRTQGVDAGMTVARSAYLAGFAGTSNVLAGQRYGIPVSGTMAHSFVMAFASEQAAFDAYAGTFPESTVLLIDTYDVAAGARHAAATAAALRDRGSTLVGVRLDSGDLVAQSIAVRRILDDAGFPEVKIFASNSLDEFAIEALLAAGAPIDAFGVGTRMGVSADRPYLDIVYKLVRLGARGVRKRSAGKATVAGEKQVFRKTAADGTLIEDIIGCRDEAIEGAAPMLVPVLAGGRPVGTAESLTAVRERVSAGVAALPAAYRTLKAPPRFPVALSPRLAAKQP